MKQSIKKPTVKQKPGTNDMPIDKCFLKFLRMLPDDKEFIFQFLDFFPIPVEIFSPDGTVVFFNKAVQKLNNVSDPGLLIGKYNVRNDPVCNDQMGLRNGIQRAFLHGEACTILDVVIPVQDLIDRNVINERPFEKAFADWYLYPVKKGKKLAFVVFINYVKNLYYGRPDLARAKEYMDKHWQDDYDAHAVAKSVNMSVAQLYSLFKKNTGFTPGDYHRHKKIEYIKVKLKDKTLSIKEAFSECGADSRGAHIKTFKKVTGMSPLEYRNSLI